MWKRFDWQKRTENIDLLIYLREFTSEIKLEADETFQREKRAIVWSDSQLISALEVLHTKY